jgi:hypothetical protein
MKWTLALTLAAALTAQPKGTMLDAHNCYPYDGQYADRIERALKTGLPVAIEQDLAWTGTKSVLSHEVKTHGAEPGMKEYFFERVRPMVEQALREGNKGNWPLLTLNLDFKTTEPEHAQAVLRLLEEYQAWLTSAPKSPAKAKVDWKPILVLVGDHDVLEQTFDGPGVKKVLAFGAAKVASRDATLTPKQLVAAKATNYRRWWNSPWSIVEHGGQAKAGSWTIPDHRRLRAIVRHAHAQGYWLRLYTLNGHAESEGKAWSKGYNFGSLKEAQLRWEACRAAGVDYLATDQYEELAKFYSAR